MVTGARIVVFLAAVGLAFPVHAQRTWYVSLNGNNTDGTNWTTAFTSIHSVWTNLLPGDTVCLAGHLFPVTNSLSFSGTNLTLIGGFEAQSETPGSRDPTQWPTILVRANTNYYRILEFVSSTNVVLDGLTIRNGLLAGTIYGAGLYFTNAANVSVLNCVIESNQLTHTAINQYPAGAGLYAINSFLVVSNSLFRWNRTYAGVLNYNGSGHGAALFISSGSLTMADCLVVSNRGEYIGNQRSSGPGLYLNGGTHTIRRTQFLYNTGNGYGGAIYQTGNNVALLENVIIRGNYATLGAGGLYMDGGTLRNVLIAENATAGNSGGAFVTRANSLLYNVTIVRNSSDAVGSVAGLNLTAGAATNVIAYYNYRTVDMNWGANLSSSGGSIGYSCTLPARSGTGNTSANPEFVDWVNGDYRLRPGSPAMDNGLEMPWMTDATDLAGGPRIRNGTPDQGAYEAEGPMEGPLRCNLIADPLSDHDSLTTILTAYVHGSNAVGLTFRWDLDNDGELDVQGTDKEVITNTFGLGRHSLRLEVENSLSETTQTIKTNYLLVSPSEIYVWSGGDHSTGDSWARAFTNLQKALDETIGTNLIYLAGETFNLGTTLIWSDKTAVEIRGGYEATNTLVEPGPRDPTLWPTILQRSGANLFRVVDAAFLRNCVLDGVTVAKGNTPTAYDVGQGGGMRIVSSIMTIQDCLFSNNVVNVAGNGVGWGGGLYAGNSTVTVVRARFIRNKVAGDPTTNNNRALGGGMAVENGSATILLSRFLYNDADAIGHYGNYGGGLYLTGGGPHLIRNSLFAFNRAGPRTGSSSCEAYGGGLFINLGVVENCTIASNMIGSSSTPVAECLGGGLYMGGGFATNTIIYHNWNVRSGIPSDVYAANLGRLAWSCAPELTNAANANITADPRFNARDAGDFTLQADSPCINAGLNADWMTEAVDLAGRPRIQRGQVDMGAYETAPPAGTVILIR